MIAILIVHHAISLLETVAPAVPATPKILNIQTLQTMGTAAAGGATLSPVFTGIGQVIKQHPKVRNESLRWILPILSIVFAALIMFLEIRSGVVIDALTGFLLVGMFVGAATVGAESIFKTGVVPPGPDNHPLDAAAANAQTITIQTPTTTGVTSVLHDANAVVVPATPSAQTTGQTTPIQEQSGAQATTTPSVPIVNEGLPPSPFGPGR